MKNEVNSKRQVMVLLNQQLPPKEARNTELDKLIKEKEALLKRLNDKIQNASESNSDE